jgi:hypothetical protein
LDFKQALVRAINPYVFSFAFRCLAFAPAAYVFAAIQYSAITVPFWDHVELIKSIAAWYDGTLEIAHLWAPHNHTRPLVYRAVMLFNAAVTNWDIRSEYVYMYAAVYGAFMCHFWALNQLNKDGDQLMASMALLVVSLLVFSPVGHNNHWWSMMFQLNIANLLITFSLLTTALHPRRWSSHIAAAISCWLAAYSITNGLIALLALTVVFQVCGQDLMRPNRWSMFWAVNLAAVLMLYVPGIHVETGPRPDIGDLVWFSVAYLGAPLGGMIWFPFNGQFHIPLSTLLNGMLGSILVVSALFLMWRAKERARSCDPAALLLVGFTLFSLGGAAVTAWGRAAFDEYGISNANSSRYTVFSVYLLLGIIYYLYSGFGHGTLAGKLPPNHSRRRAALIIATFAFMVCGTITYVRASHIYVDAYHFNRMLMNAFPWGLEPTGLEKYVHPNVDAVINLKSEMQRLQLGPYAAMPLSMQAFSIGTFRRPFLLFDGRRITQRFRASSHGLKAVSVIMNTGNDKQVRYPVTWQIHDVTGENPRRIAKGTFNAKEITDWQYARLQLPYTYDSNGHWYELEFSTFGKSGDYQSVGPALYRLSDSQSELEEAASPDEIISERLTMALRLEYAK